MQSGTQLQAALAAAAPDLVSTASDRIAGINEVCTCACRGATSSRVARVRGSLLQECAQQPGTGVRLPSSMACLQQTEMAEQASKRRRSRPQGCARPDAIAACVAFLEQARTHLTLAVSRASPSGDGQLGFAGDPGSDAKGRLPVNTSKLYRSEQTRRAETSRTSRRARSRLQVVSLQVC